MARAGPGPLAAWLVGIAAMKLTLALAFASAVAMTLA